MLALWQVNFKNLTWLVCLGRGFQLQLSENEYKYTQDQIV